MSIVATRLLAVTAFALSAVVFGGLPAKAQGLPQGSYQRSCEQVHWAGTTLLAECRTREGRLTPSGLPNAGRCVGDIGNNNGQLQCNYAGGAPPPAAPAPRNPAPAQGYGQGPGYGAPAPGYGGPGYGGGYDERRERCEHLWRERNELRDRLQYTGWGPDRERLEYRLREVHENRERLGCGG